LNYPIAYWEYFGFFSLSDVLTGISIITAILSIAFLVWWDLKKKQGERFEEFKTTFLPFIDILNKKELPHGPESIKHLKTLFATQEIAVLKIKDRLRGEKLNRFTTKWEEYKKEQENFNAYILAVVTLEAQRINNNEKLLNLINKILEIAKNN
jgi:hypothetical protein